MSIYISLVTLEDRDIVATVSTAVMNASDPSALRIGLAAAVSDDFYHSFIEPLDKYSSVHIKRFSKEDVRGVGKGRSVSRFAYSGEDRILQVDSHTVFQSGWDTKIEEIYQRALQETGNEKTILTAYLGGHTIENNSITIGDSTAKYCVFTNGVFSPLIRLQAWFARPLKEFPPQARVPKKKILPAIKIGANFMFGNKNFADYSGLPNNMVFYEEEIVQTVNLLENGFALAFPNYELPLTHRYDGGDTGERETGTDLFGGNEIPAMLTTMNLYDFISGNADACERYKAYSKYDIVTGMVRPFHIPESFQYL